MPELPQIARDTLPAGYRLAPEIVTGVVIQEGAMLWLGGVGKRWIISGSVGEKCSPACSGEYAVPLKPSTRHGRVVGLRTITGPRWSMVERIIEGEPGNTPQEEFFPEANRRSVRVIARRFA